MLKLRRKLIRAYLKLTERSQYKSKSDYWPWIKISSLGECKYDIRYSGSHICRSSSYSDFYNRTENLAIIGSGPSVKMMDFAKISSVDCILLNGAIALSKEHNINPLACVIIDSTFIENRYDMLHLLPQGTNLILTPGVIRAIAERNPALLSNMNVYLTQDIMQSCYIPDAEFESVQREAIANNFSSDLDCGFIDGGTVMAVAIQLAHQIRVKNTYLVGLDISNAAMPRFYETNSNKQKSGLLENYESKILPFMQAAAAIFNASGLSIYNCSPISALPYDIIPYNDLFAAQVRSYS